ncbi:MAG: Na+/H+ antiporter subunit G [Rheinheimera sp.]
MTTIETIVAILAVIGAIFVLIGSIAMLKLPDFYTRLHGPTKATTLGLGALVLMSVLFFNGVMEQLSLQQLLIALFLFISAPITAHMLIKVAMHQKIKAVAKTANTVLMNHKKSTEKVSVEQQAPKP